MKGPYSHGVNIYKNSIAKSKLGALSDKQIRAALEPYDVALTDIQVEAVRRYLSILILWNQKVNLTALTDPQEILRRHFGESLFALRAVPISVGRLADVGSGAGFPGLALKAGRPELDVVLIERNSKKTVFLAEVSRVLGVNIKIKRSRFEELASEERTFDFITARALGDPHSLLKWSFHALRNDGLAVLWLGRQGAEELFATTAWAWRKPIPIPRSRRRVLLVGKPTK